jgi:uncharacterized protein YdgA (DUF945 family)
MEIIMRKVIAGVTGVIIATAIALPYGMGYMAENQIYKIADRLSEQPQFQVKIDNYKRDWFDAVADITVSYSASQSSFQSHSKQVIKQVTLALHQNIKHGPFLLTKEGFRIGLAHSHSDVVLPNDAQAALNEIFSQQNQKPEFTVDSTIHVNGSSEHIFKIPEFHFKTKDNETYATSGIEGHWNTSSDLNFHTGNFSFGDFTASSNKKDSLKIESPEIVFDMKRNSNGIYTGKSRFTFPGFDLVMADKPVVAMKNLEVTVAANIEKNLYHFNWSGALQEVTANNKHYGPGVFNSTLRNLDAVKLVDLQKTLDQMQDPATPTDQQQLLLFSLFSQIPAIFNRGAELRVENSFINLPQGMLKLSGKAHLQPDDGKNGGLNTFQLLTRLNGGVVLVIPKDLAYQAMLSEAKNRVIKMDKINQSKAKQMKSFAELQRANGRTNVITPAQQKPMSVSQIDAKAKEMADSFVKSLTQNGYLSSEGKEYHFNAQVRNGKVTINGKPLPSQMFPG